LRKTERVAKVHDRPDRAHPVIDDKCGPLDHSNDSCASRDDNADNRRHIQARRPNHSVEAAEKKTGFAFGNCENALWNHHLASVSIKQTISVFSNPPLLSLTPVRLPAPTPAPTPSCAQNFVPSFTVITPSSTMTVMASKFDQSDFVDTDYQMAQKSAYAAPSSHASSLSARPPTREELEIKSNDAQAKLAELKRAQEELGRERAALEEAKRRRVEFQNGRAEMLQHLARGVGLLEEAEFAARRDSEQMGRTLADLKMALEKVNETQEENWTQETWNLELTRGLTTIEHARMEWNSARLKWDVLNGPAANTELRAEKKDGGLLAAADERSFLELCKLGLALNWPIALMGLAATLMALLLMLKK